jgi:hypothetical protein
MTQKSQLTALILFSSIVWLGCAASGPGTGQSEGTPVGSSVKVRADAYLFDTEITNYGKLTSMRLEIFDADSVLALSGRAYMGKGVIKGVITSDSLLMYLPTSKQYIQESWRFWRGKDSCTADISNLNFHSYLRDLPQATTGESGAIMRTVSTSGDRTSVVVSAPGCHWALALMYYRTKDNGWRLSRFQFDDSSHTTIVGNRREFRPDVKVKAGQFQVVIPPDAERLIP